MDEPAFQTYGEPLAEVYCDMGSFAEVVIPGEVWTDFQSSRTDFRGSRTGF